MYFKHTLNIYLLALDVVTHQIKKMDIYIEKSLTSCSL